MGDNKKVCWHWLLRLMLVCAGAGCFCAVASADEPVVLDQSVDFIALGLKAYVLEDPNGQLTIEDVRSAEVGSRFLRSDSEKLSVGFTHSVYWFRFTLENPAPESQEWLLDYPYRTMDWIELYRPLPSGDYSMTRVGDIFPLADRDIVHDHFLFKLRIPRGEKRTYFFRVNSRGGAMVVPLKLARPIAFYQSIRREDVIWGLTFGILGILVAYSFFQYLSVRDRGHLYYALTMGAAVFNYLILSGWGSVYIWGDVNAAINNWFPKVWLVSAFFFLAYNRSLLDTAKHLPRTDFLLKGSLCCVGLFFCLSFIFSYQTSLLGSYLFLLWTLFLAILANFLRYRQNYWPSRYPLLGSLAMILSAGSIILRTAYGQAPTGGLDFWAILGLWIEALMLSFALSSRYMILRVEKERAQAEKLEIQNTVVDELKRADQLKDHFLANTSHELRTPLHGILGLCEAIVGDPLIQDSEKQKRNVGLIANSARRLSHLVNDILDFSRLKNEDLRLNQKSVEIQASVRLVCLLCEPSIGPKMIELVHDLPESPLYVHADEERLQQILFNLMSNAIKFTHQGRVGVSVEPGDGEIWVHVADSGIGIPEDKQQEIFKPFTQADGSIGREYGGTGLGLAISQQLIQLHGGRMTLRSRPGEGSTFSFSLPRATAESTESDSSRLPLTLESPERIRFPVTALPVGRNKITPSELASHSTEEVPLILVVDDEPLNIEILSNQLLQEGFRTELALDGFQALAKIEEQVPDLILLDLMMPRMNGYEVCQKIRESFSAAELPIIIVTAKGQMDALVTGLKAGANDYLSKPFYQDELMARVKSQLTQKQAIGTLKENELLSSRIQYIEQVESSLRFSEKRLSQMLNKAKEAILAVEESGEIIFANEAFAKSLGYTAEELLRQPILRLLSPVRVRVTSFWPPEEGQWDGASAPTPVTLKTRDDEDWAAQVWGAELDLEEATWIFTFSPPNAEVNAEAVPFLSQWARYLGQNERSMRKLNEVLQELPATLMDASPEVIEDLQAIDQLLDRLSTRVSLPGEGQTFEELIVHVMKDAVKCWEDETGKGIIELAEDSGLWAVNIDEGRLRVRSMERYFEVARLPKKPRWRNVIKTGHFVLTRSGKFSPLKARLEKSLHYLVQAVHQRNLSPPVEPLD